MRTFLSLAIALVFGIQAAGQITLPVTGTKYVNQCYGNIADDGLNGNGTYSHNADGTLVINPGLNGNTALTFTTFNVSYGDMVYIYSGDYSQGGATLMYSYNGSALPNSGNTIIISGTMSVRLYSNGYTSSSGFTATFYTNVTGTLASNFSAPTSVSYNDPVTFANTSTGAVTYFWDFDDGTTTTEKNPTHSFTQSGTKNVKLIAYSCNSSDTITKTVTVGNAPQASIGDTLKLSANCGYSASTAWTVSNAANAGALNYSMEFRDSADVAKLKFEDGTLEGLTQPVTNTLSTLTNTTAKSYAGSHSAMLSGYSYGYEVEYDVNSDDINYIKYATSATSYVFNVGNVEWVNTSGNWTLAATRWRYNNFYISYQKANGVIVNDYYLYGTWTSGDWAVVEFKNIDWTANTYDLWVNNILVEQNARFYSACSGCGAQTLDKLTWYNGSSSSTSYLDQVVLTDNGLVQNLSQAPASVNVFGGSSSTISVTADATDLNAGVYYLEALISSNDTAINNTVLPVELTVLGESDFTTTSNCMYYNQIPVSLTTTDSLLVTNDGCADLNIDSIATQTSVFTASFAPSTLSPGESAYLYVDAQPTASGSYVDTVYFYEGADVHKICLNASVVNTAIISPIDTVVQVFSGCPGTVNIPFTLKNDGLAIMNWSEGFHPQYLTDNAEQTAPADWWNTTPYFTTSCGVINGTRSFYLQGYSREFTTDPIDFSGGGTISFKAGPSSNCYTPSNYSAYYIDVQYRKTSTSSWTTIQSFYPTTLQDISVTLPSAAWSANTEIRIGISNSYLYGTWLVDDFVIEHRITSDLSPASGTISGGDSSTVNAVFDLSGYEAGTYYLGAGIESNDPVTDNYMVYVKAIIEGEATLDIGPALCFDLDTVFTTGSSVREVEIINTGCRGMTIDSLKSTTSDLTYVAGALSVPVGDTTDITLTYAPSTTGSFNDTVMVYTTDSAFALCVYGDVTLPPSISMDTTTIYATAVNCGDDVVINLPIANTGTASLNWEVMEGRPFEVLIIDEDYYPAHLPKLIDFLEGIPDVHVTRANTSSSISARLSKTDLVIFPPNTVNSTSTYYSSLANMMYNYMQGGGSVMIMGSAYANQMLYMGNMFTGSSTIYASSNYYMYIPSTYYNHPYLANVPTSFLSPNGTFGAYLYNGNTLLYNSYYRETLVTLPQGSGELIYYGWVFNSTTQNPYHTIMENIVTTKQDSLGTANWLQISPASGSSPSNDTGYVQLTLSSDSLLSGTYETMISVTSNDPSHTGYTIPISFTVVGSGEMTYDNTACIDMGDIYQNATYVDSFLVKNTGCDTLVIDSSSFAANVGYVDGNTYPLSLVPGDSVMTLVSINTASTGTLSDTLIMYVDGSAYTKCITAEGNLAPSLSVTPSAFNLKLNQCKGFETRTVTVTNNGQGSADYDLWVGDRYEVSSTKYYANTSYATTTHSLGTLIDADTLYYELVLNGDFGDYSERVYWYFGNSYYGNIYDNDATDGTNDTVTGYITGSYLTYLKSLTNIQLTIYNNYYVAAGVGDQLHHVRFWMNGTPDWLTISNPKQGTLNSGSSMTRTVTFNPTGLPLGTYTSFVNVESNDPANPWIKIPVTMEVANDVAIALGQNQLNYGNVTATSVQDSVLVINDGCQTLNVTNITSSNTHFVPGWTTKSIPIGSSEWLPITFTPTQQGLETGNISIANNDSLQILSVIANAVYAPQSSFTYQVLDSCSGQVAFFDDSQNATSKIWLFGDGGSSSNANPVHNYDKPGQYSVRFVASNTAGSDTSSMVLDLQKILYVEMDYPAVVPEGLAVQFYDSSVVANSWQWYFGDGGSASVKNPTHVYNGQNTYVVTLQVTSADGCASSINRTILVESGVGLGEDNLPALNVYPNPTSRFLSIETPQLFSTMSVYNAIGERMLITEFDTQLDVSALPAGEYTLELSGNEPSRRIKFTVVH